MPITTDSTALNARFDMLFSARVKEYVKKNGGGAYIRELVYRDIMEKLNSTRGNLTDAERNTMRNIFDAEVGETVENGRVA